MTCQNCKIACKRFGKHRNGLQRYRCNRCKKTYTEEHKAAFSSSIKYTSLSKGNLNSSNGPKH